ncbi:hypothetical protein H4582DRAFT_2174347 [Lactarius indigo]|nr:hypothetical protein H4582DRAFT_2174347 [Lactarius indigo]
MRGLLTSDDRSTCRGPAWGSGVTVPPCEGPLPLGQPTTNPSTRNSQEQASAGGLGASPLVPSATFVRLPHVATILMGRYQRALHDLLLLLGRLPIISQGRIGCTDFLGCYPIAKLAKVGTPFVNPYRDEDEKRHLKVTGNLGWRQIISLKEWDICDKEQIAEHVWYTDIVYNLVGRDYETIFFLLFPLSRVASPFVQRRHLAHQSLCFVVLQMPLSTTFV